MTATTPPPMDYLIRFVQIHETFRKPETEALAELAEIEIEWIFYADDSPYGILRLKSGTWDTAAVTSLLARSMLTTSIYELWGAGTDYSTLHADVRARTAHIWPAHTHKTFRFQLDSYHGSRSTAARREIYESFQFMGFTGAITMHNPDNGFTVFEESRLDAPLPFRYYLGRDVAVSGRKAMNLYSLKKRTYIATTSMDAELSLVTANLALVAPGRIAYDPFMGTGSFPLSCAHFGAAVAGSDLDGRSIRGAQGRNVRANFAQYGTEALYLGGFVADLTNSPLRCGRAGGAKPGTERFLDAIVCDPPYGVREGLKVLGSTRVALREVVYLNDGTPAHLQKGYVPPKKPYSFFRMLDDILDFGAERLVDGGRLCMWMPVAGPVEETGTTAEQELARDGEQQSEFAIPKHPALRVVSVCTQDFNKWSRRLLTYRRLRDDEVDQTELVTYQAYRLSLNDDEATHGHKFRADDLNEFRRKYFQGFRDEAAAVDAVKQENGKLDGK